MACTLSNFGCRQNLPSKSPSNSLVGSLCQVSPHEEKINCPVENAPFQITSSAKSENLIIKKIEVEWKSNLDLKVFLKGKFQSETDQAIHVFWGGESGARKISSFKLTQDDSSFSSFGYSVWNELKLPHHFKRRLGTYYPDIRANNPQVYVGSDYRSLLTGPESGIQQSLEGDNEILHLKIPATAMSLKPSSKISMTIATARKYVGFIDSSSLLNLGPGKRRTLTPSPQRATLHYPDFRPESHRFKQVVLNRSWLNLNLSWTMMDSDIDWGQTNFEVFIFDDSIHEVGDYWNASHTVKLPGRWKIYCAVYSPHAYFCKLNSKSDPILDSGFAERKSLGLTQGISFTSFTKSREKTYELAINSPLFVELSNKQNWRIILISGRDGAASSSWVGL